jgi:hypothetical protein
LPAHSAAAGSPAVQHLEEREHGIRITLPISMGDRTQQGVQVGIPYGGSALCRVRAGTLAHRRGDRDPTVFLRIWVPPRPRQAPPDWAPNSTVGWQAIYPRTVARIVQAGGAAAGFDPVRLGGHTSRGARSNRQRPRVHPARLEGDLLADNALSGAL